MPDTLSRAPEDASFLTFTLAGQLCAVPVPCVRDVLAPQRVTPIPLASPEIAGSLNLRGRIVTAVELRRRLGLPAAREPRMAVVTEQSGELYALLVDTVHEVLSLSPAEIERNPPTLPPPWSTFSAGVCRRADALLVLLDVAHLLRLGQEVAA
ncbi:MAG: chemotaxis protein CheW [Janthinobacterium lividum]